MKETKELGNYGDGAMLLIVNVRVLHKVEKVQRVRL